MGAMADIVADLACQLSVIGPVAYVEAEFFADAGGQSAIVWQQRQIILALQEDGIGAINTALRYLGVQASSPTSWFDEFSMVGLGRERDTEKWGKVVVQQEANGVSEWKSEQLRAALTRAEKALNELDPMSPIYQVAEQQLEELRRKTRDEGNITRIRARKPCSWMAGMHRRSLKGAGEGRILAPADVGALDEM
ncbi:hypothetical protein KSX_79990 [Ktedonospora formicarum]|uniref:Uncharacterized protein n=1 Tax=Ktedonospora formicarum TaxID=2778364 RepID=A0A8J3I714_9CHLR|nr:hypothetical protein KSX_79990 [Ktedonospora formicarum]